MPSRYRTALVLAVLIVAASLCFATEPLTATKGPIPVWVVPFPYDFNDLPLSSSQQGGATLLVFDYQQNLRTAEAHARKAHHVVTPEGVENFSDISFEFNPAFSTLTINTLRIHRDGLVLDRLPDVTPDVFRREQSLEAGLLDGVATAVIHVPDVRPGDVLEYGVTFSGENPLLAGQYTNRLRQRFTHPCGAIYHRVITAPGRVLHEHLFNDARAYTVSDTRLGREYTWSGRNLSSLFIDTNVPPWYDPTPHATLTSFANWPQVRDWAVPLYEVAAADKAELAVLAADLLAGNDLEQRILAAIHFVQDDVRYLGREEGIWALQPRSPLFCFQQRFGDCKEKSLLLVTLLEMLDVEAFPLLVSSYYLRHLHDQPPSPENFDHCVVGIEYDGGAVYVDPTISLQGGGLDSWYFPGFGAGLAVRPDAGHLIDLPPPTPLRYEVHHAYEIGNLMTGDAKYTVTTRCYDGAADQQRAYMAATDFEQLGRGFVAHYSAQFPGISLDRPLEVAADDRHGENMRILIETYHIEDIWKPSQSDSTMNIVQIAPLDLQNYLTTTPSPSRTSPYYIGHTVDMTVRTEALMPRSWPVQTEPTKIVGHGYSFLADLYNQGPVVHASFRYKRDIDVVPADETQTFLADHARMKNATALYLYGNWQHRFRFKGLAITLAVIALIGCGALAATLHWRYDPEPAVPTDRPRTIGGPLILVTVGLLLRPVHLLYAAYKDPSLYGQATWDMAAAGNGAAPPAVALSMLVVEIVATAAMLIWSLWLLWLFFDRRSSLPRVIVACLIFTVAFYTFDALAMAFMQGDSIAPGVLGVLMGTWIAAAAGIPYFLVSRRVKETFVSRDFIEAEPSTTSEALETPMTETSGDDPDAT